MTPPADPTARYAAMLAAIGTEPRLRILRLLLRAHPEGLVVGDKAAELDQPGATLTHHHDKRKQERRLQVRRDGTFLWYSANTAALQELLGFLYAECCTRTRAVSPQKVTSCR